VQINNENWNYNKKVVKEMGMMIVMQMQLAVDDDGDDTLASNDPCSSKDDALCKFSFKIPFGC
jgi:hypothetical protein